MRRTIALSAVGLLLSALFLAIGSLWIQEATPPVAAQAQPPQGLITAAQPAVPTATVVCPGGWTVVPSPNSGPDENELRHLAVVEENDIWAVGHYIATGGLYQTLTEHWDGATWSVVPSPNRPGVGNHLYGVAARATDDVWAVGATDPIGATSQRTLIEHWDGQNWTMVPSPSPSADGVNILSAVTMLTANDGWAVGVYDLVNLTGRQALTLHWDGVAWTQVPTPLISVDGGNEFYGVSALAANDVWAVGTDTSYYRYHTLIEHWDGTAWTRVSSPNLTAAPEDQPLAADSYLRSVTMITATDGWAVGSNDQGRYTLILHWDGMNWRIVQPYNLHGHLEDVVARGPNDVWAVGQGRDLNAGVLVLHWDGLAWQSTPAPNPSAEDNIAYGMAATGGGDLWLVGAAGPSTAHQTLIERNPACVGGPPTATPTPNCATGWNPVTSPNTGSTDTQLNGVAVMAPDAVWAVGKDGLILYWDGASWGVVPSVPAQEMQFSAVAATAPDDVWAVGSYRDGVVERTLVEHWDGGNWSIVPSPNPPPGDNRLYAVTALASNDVWAVGIWGPSGPVRTLVEHWDGVEWSVVPSPSLSQINSWLLGVTAHGPNDIWAVGYSDDYRASNVLIEHWDGTAWAISPTPNYTSIDTQVSSVTALAPDDVWAVGQFAPTTTSYQTFALHWDGTQWTRVTTPSPGPSAWLKGVAAIAPDNVWAVGQSSATAPLIEHWDGAAWQLVAAPPRGFDSLTALAAVRPGELWAVGRYYNGAVYRTLTDHYTGPCGTPTATPQASATVTTTSTTATITPNLPPPTTTPTATATPTTTPNCTPIWNVLPSPNGGSGDSLLKGIAVLAPDDIWAVGSYGGGYWLPLVEHWDGTAWMIVPSPNAGMGSVLYAVAGRAPNDVWAVGDFSTGAIFKTLVEHWDGYTWSIVPSANGLFMDNRLNAVAIRAHDDAWAAGLYENNGIYATLIEHWDGTQWSIIPSPNPGTYHFLTGLSALASNNAWAVGWYSGNLGPLGPQTLILHWDGSSWSIVSSPNLSANGRLNSITSITPDNMWAAGYYVAANGLARTLVEHWNGNAWSIVPSPGGPENNVLAAITASGANHVWATGYTLSASGTSYRTLALYWDGSTWSLDTSPSIGLYDNLLFGAAAVGNEMWTVGYYAPQAGGFYKTLIEQHIDPCVTPCTLAFVDVPPGSTFYDFVRCLACRGIVGGYPCGTPGEPCPGTYYRPGNNVTRGQTAKIVSTSAAFADPIPSSQQTFEDVTPGSTFALWVERLAGRGILGGYPCGGAGEPCVAPANRPYFRPNNNVTRGQLAKITGGAAGYTETPTGQTFADVPPGSTFYLYIERLAARAIMSGYPCGGPTEPCVAPANRPYFRPGNPATRGQAAKILANTFLPNCQTPAVGSSETNSNEARK